MKLHESSDSESKRYFKIRYYKHFLVKILVVFSDIAKVLQENHFLDARLIADLNADSTCPLHVGLHTKAH